MSSSRQLLILSLLQVACCIGLLVVGFHFSGVCFGLAWAVLMNRDAIKQEQREHEAYIADVMDTNRA